MPLLWKFRKQVDGRNCSWWFRADFFKPTFLSFAAVVTDYLCIKIKIVGEGERAEGLGSRLLLFTRNSPDFPEVILCPTRRGPIPRCLLSCGLPLSCVECGVLVSCMARVQAQLRSGQCGWSVGLCCLEGYSASLGEHLVEDSVGLGSTQGGQAGATDVWTSFQA